MNEAFFRKLISLDVAPDYYTVLWAGMVLFVVVSRLVLAPFKKEEQTAFLVTIFGFLLAWSSQGVWLSLVGLLCTVLSGGAILIRAEKTAEDTETSVHFIRRNLMGILITSVGTCGLVSLDYAMDYSSTVAWTPHISDLTLRISVGLILLGLMTVMVPWTAQNVVMKKSRLNAFDHLLFTIAFPSVSAFSILLRLHGHLEEVGLFQVLGWASLCLGVLLTLPVYLRNKAEEASDHLMTLIPLLGVSTYCFAGAWTSFIVIFSSFAFAFVISILRIMGTHVWGKVLAALAAYGWLGGMGYVSSGAYLAIGQNLREHPFTLGLFGVFYFLFSIQVWRILFSYIYSNTNPQAASWKWIIPSLWSLLPLGIFFTGTLTGGALPPGVDQVDGLNPSSWSWLSFFDLQNQNWDEERYMISSAVHWSLFLVSAGVAAFTRTPTKDRLELWPDKFARAVTWSKSGFGMIWLTKKTHELLEWMGAFFQQTLSEKVWGKLIPTGFDRIRLGLEKIGLWIDRVSSSVTSDRLSVLVKAPSQLVQLTQSGNLQWYLAFGLIGSLLVLIHFIRF